jgi:hypothetical protein
MLKAYATVAGRPCTRPETWAGLFSADCVGESRRRAGLRTRAPGKANQALDDDQ